MEFDVSGKPTRRRFFFVTAGTTAGALCAVTTGADQAHGDSSASKTVTRTTRALGTKVAITALQTDDGSASRAIDAAFAELKLVESLMSIYRAESQLCRLNRRRVLFDPHPYLLEVLQAAEQMSRHSDGAFDITVQPLWTLFASAKTRGRLPTDADIAAARERVDWRQVEVTPKRVRLRGEAAITLNGIAQGFAADRATDTLRRHGVTGALINTGEFCTLGTNARGERWNIGVQHPRRADALISVAQLAGRCLATSGDYATSFSDDHRWNHLFDPRTGRSPDELSSVSVVARTALTADALSTAVFVLGARNGLALVRRTEGADALLVEKSGRLLATPDFPFHL